MLRRDQFRQSHVEDVMKLLNWRDNRKSVEEALRSDLDIDCWDGPDYPVSMLRDFRGNQDKYIEIALDFLSVQREWLFGSPEWIDGMPEVYAADLLQRESAYLMAQLAGIFIQRQDDAHWCLQILQNGSIEIPHLKPWFPWDEDVWLFGLKRPENSEYFSPVLAKLEFMDGVKFLRNGEPVSLINKGLKMSAFIENKSGVCHTVRFEHFRRFAPAMDWSESLYSGFLDRTICEDHLGPL
jgi:hypothetical protein